MTLQSSDEMDFAAGPFPERPGEPDCLYYVRTGLCGFGMNCRFNHPPKRQLVAVSKGEYPERFGQPECQYFLKTGNCKFGSTCKYHHPREKAGTLGRVTVNIVGLPLRLDEKDCAYYMRTGSCKFGMTCKFNHPQPATFVTMSGSSMYASAGSPSAPSPQPFPTGHPSWAISRSYVPGSRFQGPSSFAPLIVPPQSLVSMPAWNTYQARMGAAASLEVQQQALGTSFVYGAMASTDTVSGGVHAPYNPYVPGSAATGFPSMQMQSTSLFNDSVFPERPGLPECQYYMKTGDCKFGPSCRYHHPRERISLVPNAILSPIGLPLRAGVPHCKFYTQYGICKFGPTCKFDHPMSSVPYSPSASSLLEMPIAPYPVGRSIATLEPSSSETSVQVPNVILKETAGASDEQETYENSYIDGNSDERDSSSIHTVIVNNQSTNPETGDSSHVLNSSS